jgi:predicted N-acyltransferase
MHTVEHTVEVCNTAADIDPDEWDALGGGLAFAGHRWLRLVEAVRPDLEPRYLLVRRHGRVVAAAAGTVGHRLSDQRLDATVGAVLRRWPALHIGNPVTGTDGLLVDGVAGAGRELGVLLQAVHARVKRERFLFCLVDQLPPRHPVWAVRQGYQPLAWLPVARLDLPWTTFEHFLAGLPRKKRQEIRRGQRHAEREGIVVERLTPTDDDGPHLDRLVANVLRRHRETFEFAAGLFAKATAILRDDLIVLGSYRHGQLVGCVALLRDNDELTAKWIGRDYERSDRTSAYHALVTECVRTAIALGARRLHFGASAQATKQQFGVEWETRGRLLASRSRTVNWCFGKLRPQSMTPEPPPDAQTP